MTIKQFRENKGMTQGELAAALGTSQVAVSRWESGAVQPSAATLRKLAAVFGCQMDDIKPAARKLKAKDIFTREAYEGLTAEERRYTLKVEQAKEYSGWRAYGTTMSRLLKRIPDECGMYTAPSTLARSWLCSSEPMMMAMHPALTRACAMCYNGLVGYERRSCLVGSDPSPAG